MKKWKREVGTITKQPSKRDVTAFSKEGESICMQNRKKSVEMSIRGFKQSHNGVGGKK